MAELSPQPNVPSADESAGLSATFWLLAIATGMGAGVGAGLLMWLLRAAQHLTWSYSTGDFLTAVQHAGPFWRISILILAGVLAGVAGFILKHRPGAHGGELAEAIWFHAGKLPFFASLWRAALSIVIVAMGASLGREAAPKLVGGALASLMASWARLSSAERRLLAACGAGAGVGAVYNVPFAGALFALEVLLGTLALPLIPPALVTSMLATWVSWLFIADQPTYVVPSYAFSLPLVVWALWVGPMAGIAAAVYVRLIAWADSLKPNGWPQLVVPVFVFAGLGALAVPYPQLLGNGKDTVQQAFVAELGLSLLAPLLVLKPLVTAACLGSGAPGGLFTPTLTYGAMFGGLMGRLWTFLWPGAPLGSYAIVGAGALLAAAMQSPIASIVFILELAPGSYSLILPLMLAVAGAVVVERRLESRSIYSGRIHQGRAQAQKSAKRPATAFDHLLSSNFTAISAASTYFDVLRKINQSGTNRRPLYVVDEKGELIGVIEPRSAVAERRLSAPPAVSTAADLANPVEALNSAMDESAVRSRIEREDAVELPVIDVETRHLVGIVATKPSRAPREG
jgi:chloride channel protein, CIC family